MQNILVPLTGENNLLNSTLTLKAKKKKKKNDNSTRKNRKLVLFCFLRKNAFETIDKGQSLKCFLLSGR